MVKPKKSDKKRNDMEEQQRSTTNLYTAWKVTKYGVTSGPCFPILIPNTGKYGPEISPYLDTSHAVMIVDILSRFRLTKIKCNIIYKHQPFLSLDVNQFCCI